MVPNAAQLLVRSSAAAQSSSLNKAVSSAARPRTDPRRRHKCGRQAVFNVAGEQKRLKLDPSLAFESGEAPTFAAAHAAS